MLDYFGKISIHLYLLLHVNLTRYLLSRFTCDFTTFDALDRFCVDIYSTLFFTTLYLLFRYVMQWLHLALRVYQQGPFMEQGLGPNMKEIISQSLKHILTRVKGKVIL